MPARPSWPPSRARRPLLSGANTTSPRTEIPLAVDATIAGHGAVAGNVSAIIVGAYKYLEGTQQQSFWQGPAFPNASNLPYGQITDPKLRQHCGSGLHPLLKDGCLYNIRDDPTEQTDLAARLPHVAAALRARLDVARKTKFETADDSQTEACLAQVKANGNFYGPWLP